ncbi:uncharacterized protein LOC111059990 isoform X2 [Nilaparvata lugens]|uniref:uncharacterized protein LOC111059990 isoform X2 n=1 Tax=Nilaparvata lugens TaxID=108931 RepID=UPI00193EAB58|nr:uncharacterized protein LOC111059990 isoform X2 [Nilaparvata lugens]
MYIFDFSQIRFCWIIQQKDELLKAREKERLAEKESDLQTEGDDVLVLDGRRKKRKITKKIFFSSSDSSGDECSQNVKKTLFSKDQYCYPARAPSPPMSQSQRDSTSPQLFATPLSSVISSPANSSIERTTVTQSGLNVVANRIAKLELEIVKLKEYLENILPQIAGLNKQQPSTETLTTTSIPPLPCNEKEEVENLEVWLESEQNQNFLVQYLGRVGGKTVDYVVRKTLAR